MSLSYYLNILWILIYCAVIGTAIGLQIFNGEEPCPLCYIQRAAMLLVSLTALMNLHFGIREVHLGLAIIGSLFGGAVALRQIALHACPGSPTFGVPFWGLSLYTWSFLTFASSLLMCAILLLLYKPIQSEKPAEITSATKGVTLLFLLITAVNVVSSYIDCGFGPCD